MTSNFYTTTERRLCEQDRRSAQLERTIKQMEKKIIALEMERMANFQVYTFLSLVVLTMCLNFPSFMMKCIFD
jgi:septal ring factor EnvC (AmiA/AmiB activator)